MREWMRDQRLPLPFIYFSRSKHVLSTEVIFTTKVAWLLDLNFLSEKNKSNSLFNAECQLILGIY